MGWSTLLLDSQTAKGTMTELYRYSPTRVACWSLASFSWLRTIMKVEGG